MSFQSRSEAVGSRHTEQGPGESLEAGINSIGDVILCAIDTDTAAMLAVYYVAAVYRRNACKQLKYSGGLHSA